MPYRDLFLGAPICAALVIVSLSPALAQQLPNVGGNVPGSVSKPLGGLSGGAGGLAGQMLPSLSSASTGNVAGILSYCIQNNNLQGGAATTTLDALTHKNGVTSSSAYAAGQQGQIETGGGNSFSLSGVQQQVKTKVCDMVLERAKSLL
jgi:Protein of unknown function (DUF2501)